MWSGGVVISRAGQEEGGKAVQHKGGWGQLMLVRRKEAKQYGTKVGGVKGSGRKKEAEQRWVGSRGVIN